MSPSTCGEQDESSPLLRHHREQDSSPSSASTATAPSTAETDRSKHVPGEAASGASSENGQSLPSSPLFPTAQLLILCYARLVEPIAFFSIFSYVNKMVQDNGHLPITDVGFYSGLIESLFSLTQMCVMVMWGRASDRIGRKPVLVLSLAGVTCCVSLFGFATTVWQMILFRCLAGVFAGSIVTVRTMIAELSGPETQGTAFSWFAFAGNVGIFVGPLIGGALADPVNQYSWFPRMRLFVDYPYALPGVGCALIGASAALACALFLDETLKPAAKSDGEAAAEAYLPSSSGAGVASGPMSTRELLLSPGVAPALVSNGLVLLIAYGFTTLSTVVLFTPVELGGFSFSTVEISMFLCATGLSQGTWLLVVFPHLQRRIGSRACMRVLSRLYPWMFPPFIISNALLRIGTPAATVGFQVLAAFYLVLCPGLSMVVTASQLVINNASPTPRTLATLNAFSLMVASGVRAFGPAAFGSLYAITIRKQWLWGQVVWVVLMLFAFLFAYSTKFLAKNKQAR